MIDIRINEPGAGKWIMDRCGGVFRPELDQSIASFRDGKIMGGFVLCQYLGNSICVHDAAENKRWCSRELMWMLFHYIFRQLKCHKAYAPTPSDNYHALELNLRAGWRLETVMRDAIASGRHLMLLAMEAGTCPWLLLIPQSYFPGDVVEKVTGHGS